MGALPVVSLAERSTAVSSLLDGLVADRVASRLFASDASLWGADAEAEASERLGWVSAPEHAPGLLDAIDELRAELIGQGLDRVVLCGMGGSSLGPEVIARASGAPLTVLDSTHPASVRRVLDEDPARTVVVVSSKSGSTIETRSHLAAFEHRFAEAGISPASRIVVVTDPGSPLEAAASEAGYRVFLADPRIGGRFSALTAFGLVPAGLAGADVRALVDAASDLLPLLADDAAENPSLQLAAAIASGLPGRYACLLAESAPRSGLGDWIEQLVAESTGKNGVGVLPVVLSPDAPELRESRAPEAVLIALTLSGAGNAEPESSSPTEIAVRAPLGAQMLLWEAATAVLCRLIGVNPFDQPDVEAAKVAARAALADPAPADSAESDVRSGDRADIASELARLRGEVPAGGYLAIQAYLDEACMEALGRLRDAFAAAWGVPVTLGIGPRFLHSTGQLHKGGAPIGVYLQLLDAPTELAIPHSDAGFATLIAAQARGDREVLRERGRPVLALRSADAAGLIERIRGALAR